MHLYAIVTVSLLLYQGNLYIQHCYNGVPLYLSFQK